MRKIRLIQIFSISVLLVLSSCQDVVNLDLNKELNTEPFEKDKLLTCAEIINKKIEFDKVNSNFNLLESS